MIKVKEHLNNIYRKDPHVDKSKYKWRLDQSERVSGYDKEFFQDFLKTLKDTDFICYPYVKTLKEKIKLHHELNSIENIFLTPGSDVAIRTMFDLCVSPGDEVISTIPSFPMYKVYSKLYQANFIGVSYNKDLTWSVSELISKISSSTSLIIIANPNNPIGDYKMPEELKDLFIYTQKLGIPVLIDEAYVQFIPDSFNTCIKSGFEFQNVVTCRTFSKALGGAGVRVGYMISDNLLMDNLKKWRFMHEVTNPSVKFASYILDNYDTVKDYITKTNYEKQKLIDILKLKYDVIGGHCNWIHVNDKNDNKFVCSVLDKYKEVIYRAGTTIPHDLRKNWLRLTIGPDLHKEDFIKKILELK